MNRRSFFGFLAGAPLAVAAGKVALAQPNVSVRALSAGEIKAWAAPLNPVFDSYAEMQAAAGMYPEGTIATLRVGPQMLFEDAYPPHFYDHDKINPPGSDTMDMVEFEAGKERQRVAQAKETV